MKLITKLITAPPTRSSKAILQSEMLGADLTDLVLDDHVPVSLLLLLDRHPEVSLLVRTVELTERVSVRVRGHVSGVESDVFVLRDAGHQFADENVQPEPASGHYGGRAEGG